MKTLRRGERGFSIIETMAATLIIAVGFLGLAGVHALSSSAQSLGRSQGHAAMIAGQEIEQMRRSTFAGVTSGSSSKQADGEDFQVLRSVTAVVGAKRIDVTVTWEERLGTKSVLASSLVSQVTNP